jgi:hypothetical protein
MTIVDSVYPLNLTGNEPVFRRIRFGNYDNTRPTSLGYIDVRYLVVEAL